MKNVILAPGVVEMFGSGAVVAATAYTKLTRQLLESKPRAIVLIADAGDAKPDTITYTPFTCDDVIEVWFGDKRFVRAP